MLNKYMGTKRKDWDSTVLAVLVICTQGLCFKFISISGCGFAVILSYTTHFRLVLQQSQAIISWKLGSIPHWQAYGKEEAYCPSEGIWTHSSLLYDSHPRPVLYDRGRTVSSWHLTKYGSTLCCIVGHSIIFVCNVITLKTATDKLILIFAMPIFCYST